MTGVEAGMRVREHKTPMGVVGEARSNRPLEPTNRRSKNHPLKKDLIGQKVVLLHPSIIQAPSPTYSVQ